jgi:hypothetical protein
MAAILKCKGFSDVEMPSSWGQMHMIARKQAVPRGPA